MLCSIVWHATAFAYLVRCLLNLYEFRFLNLQPHLFCPSLAGFNKRKTFKIWNKCKEEKQDVANNCPDWYCVICHIEKLWNLFDLKDNHIDFETAIFSHFVLSRPVHDLSNKVWLILALSLWNQAIARMTLVSLLNSNLVPETLIARVNAPGWWSAWEIGFPASCLL